MRSNALYDNRPCGTHTPSQYNGVRQGEVDSSDAFALFVDDLDAELERAEVEAGRKLGIPLIGTDDANEGTDWLSVLKHADDTVILAGSEADAQLLLRAVERWCEKWCISPNPDKCVVMCFSAIPTPVPRLRLLGQVLKVVESTVYLGYLLAARGVWRPHVERRVGKAAKWDAIATQLLGHHGGVTAGVAAEVRGATAEVGSLYGGEFWGSSISGPSQTLVDQAQASVAKQILHVRASSEAAGVLTELGWASSSTTALRMRLLFWWRLGGTKSELLRTLEWQAVDALQVDDEQPGQVSEYNWWRGTLREVAELSELAKLPSDALRALPRGAFCQLLDRLLWRREFRARLHSMRAGSRLQAYADSIEERTLQDPKICSWKALRAGYLEFVSSRYHVRLLAMTRLGTLPVEVEIGRWVSKPRDERVCEHCPAPCGSALHFCHECTGLSAPLVPRLNACPTGPDAGPWWRRTARALEMRWREKCQLRAEASDSAAEVQRILLSSFDDDSWEQCEALPPVQAHFLSPGAAPPPGLAFEVFSDGSLSPTGIAGWGVWAVFLTAASLFEPFEVLSCKGRVVLDPKSEHFIGAEKGTNMTAELTAIFHALGEVLKLPVGSVCLLRYDCIPALLLAAGILRPKHNVALVQSVHELWKKVCQSHMFYVMHAKGHSGIYGNVQADRLAEKGTKHEEGAHRDRQAVHALGGPVRFADLYVPGDCGRDCDLERKYAGKARAKRAQARSKHTQGTVSAAVAQLRRILGVSNARAERAIDLALES